jgi:diadenosine tetraphosphate (Ap4A) HIT family hydrolase
LKALERPVLRESPREGKDGPNPCFVCDDQSRYVVWTDEHWLVRHLGEPSALPVVLMLCPTGHHDLLDLPPQRAAELGPMMQRVERAILSLGGIARVHTYKIGEHSSHLHPWLFARPAGLTQLASSNLPTWDDLLPKQNEAQWRAVLRELGAALSADGGTAFEGRRRRTLTEIPWIGSGVIAGRGRHDLAGWILLDFPAAPTPRIT